MKIKGLSNYRGRNPHGYFQDLPWKVRQKAYAWLSRFLKRHPYCPGWRFAILVGQAKRLALMSDPRARPGAGAAVRITEVEALELNDC